MSKKIFLQFFFAFFCVFSLFSYTNIFTSAAEFVSGDKVNIDQSKTNLYASGDKVVVTSPIQKDLVAAGGSVDISGSVERNTIVAGGDVDIDVDRIGANLRVVGGDVKISGIINEDVLVAGGSVDIIDATINGDLVVGAGDLSISNSIVNGNFYGGYDKYTGQELSSFVGGDVKIGQTRETRKPENKKLMIGYRLFGQISSIAALLFLLILMKKRNRLSIPSIKLNKHFGVDFLIGIGTLVVSTISLFTLFILYKIGIPLFFIVISLLMLSLLFFPVYLGNLIQNTFRLKLPIWITIISSYLGLILVDVLTKLLPVFWLINIPIYIVIIVNFGFVIRNIFMSLNSSLAKRK